MSYADKTAAKVRQQNTGPERGAADRKSTKDRHEAIREAMAVSKLTPDDLHGWDPYTP